VATGPAAAAAAATGCVAVAVFTFSFRREAERQGGGEYDDRQQILQHEVFPLFG
jgi:hypothetical protein